MVLQPWFWGYPMPHLLSLLVLALFGLLSMTTGPALAEGSSDGSSDTPLASPAHAEAQAAIEAENYAAALPILIRLTTEAPQDADAWNLLGYASRKLGDTETAGKAYGRALQINPAHLGALEYQGELFLQLGEPEKARANLERLQTLCGTCEEAEDLKAALAG